MVCIRYIFERLALCLWLPPRPDFCGLGCREGEPIFLSHPKYGVQIWREGVGKIPFFPSVRLPRSQVPFPFHLRLRPAPPSRRRSRGICI